MSDVTGYLHSGDSIYWTDPSDYSRHGPDVITGFWEIGIDANGNPGAGVNIAAVVRNSYITQIPVLLIVQRTSAFDGSVMHFRNGVPV